MAKKLSEKQKEEIVNFFTSGKSIDQLSKEFNFTKLTIVRNLKKNLGEKKYKEFYKKSKLTNQKISSKGRKSKLYEEDKLNKNNLHANISDKELLKKNSEEILPTQNPFTELVPLDYEIENSTQKDLSSIPISEVNFPKVVYMIVNNKIELETKFLKEYPDWHFLAEEELNRKTIEIFNDMKIAKRFCNKDQKIIKVPNTEVFKIASPVLISRGITRIVNYEKLIAL